VTGLDDSSSTFDLQAQAQSDRSASHIARRQRSWQRLLARAETSSFLRPSGTVLPIFTWLGYELFPLFPAPSRTRLTEKFDRLFAAISVSPLEMFSAFVEWLVLAQLLATLLGTERARAVASDTTVRAARKIVYRR
jgi:hypothetical protein